MTIKYTLRSVAVGLFVGSLTVGCGPTGNISPDGQTVADTSSALSANDNLTQVAVAFHTGGDDKRSDSQVWFHVVINGVDHQYNTGGTGSTWGNGTTTQWFYGILPGGTRNGDISNFTVTWSPGGGSFIQTGDNWNMESLDIWVWDATLNSWQYKGSPGNDPLYRFTGNAKKWSWGTWPL